MIDERGNLVDDGDDLAPRGRGPGDPDVCPYCDRVMSRREAAEQGACNDCSGGAYDPRGSGS